MFKMYAEYKDGASLYFTEQNEELCMYEITKASSIHGDVTYYSSVTDGEHYIDGEYYDHFDYDLRKYVTEEEKV